MQYNVYYMRPEFFRDGIMGSKWLKERRQMPSPHNLERTHIFLKQTEARNLDHLYHIMQGEVWSPNGEARELIRSKGLQHTSMSMGDIAVEESTGKVWMTDMFGFAELK
jgi:hypothetical protein